MAAPDPSSWRPRLVRLALSAAGSDVPAVVALLTDRPMPRLAARLGAVEYDVADPDLHVRLTAAGPFDVIADVAGGLDLSERWEGSVFQLRAGGTHLTRLPEQGRGRRRLLRRVREIRTAMAGNPVPPPPAKDGRRPRERDLAALACSLRLRRRGDVLVTVSTVDTVARLTETETTRWLILRPDLGRTLETSPATTFHCRGQVRTAPTDVVPAPEAFEVPELHLRELYGVIGHGRQAVHVDHVVLPASFRHHTRRRQPNVQLIDWAPRFMRVPDEGPVTELAGSWFLLDNYVRGHFGHVLTELISQLWGWDRARAHDPSIRVLTFTNRIHNRVRDWERELLAAYGIDDLHVAEGPTRVERLVTATPMFVLPDYVHPDLLKTYERIGAGLAARAPERERPRRIFSARPENRRSCHNAAELESWFTDAGFEIVRPEEHSLADQVAMFRDAEVIAGYSGSNLFQTAFTGGPKHVITIAPESYLALNEYLIGSVVGHRLDRVYCRPDVPHGERWSEAAYHSDYTFDPDREGVFLRKVLSELTR